MDADESPLVGEHLSDPFDSEDFQAIQYVNKLFPNGEVAAFHRSRNPVLALASSSRCGSLVCCRGIPFGAGPLHRLPESQGG